MFDRYMREACMIPINPSNYQFNRVYTGRIMDDRLRSRYTWKEDSVGIENVKKRHTIKNTNLKY